MPQIYALVESGHVANVIVADAGFVEQHCPGAVRIDALSNHPGIGWSYSGGEFRAPLVVYPPFVIATAGEPIAEQIITASGGAGAPYTFSASNLPDGLVISSAGEVSGTPGAQGAHQYTVSAADSGGNSATASGWIICR